MRMLPVLPCVLLSAFPAITQQSAALFDAAVVQLPDDSPPFQKLFDYDGDGDMDAVGSRLYINGSSYEVRVWRNDQGRFVLAYTDVQPMTGTWAVNMAIAAGDFDHDGDQDFVVGSGPSIVDYRNFNGAWLRSTTALPQKVSDLSAGDFDGDGQDDLAILLRTPVTFAAGALELRLASGALASLQSSSFELGSRLEAVNADGDAADEIGVWLAQRNEIKLFDYTPSTLAALPSLIAAVTDPNRWSYWTSGDIDGDGDTDLVAFELPTNLLAARVHCFRRVGVNTFSPDPAYLGGPAESLADVDGDGDLDGVCCGGGTTSPPYWPQIGFASQFQIALNLGTGVFAKSFPMPGKGARRLAGVADVDLDGDADLVAGAAVFYAQGPWTKDVSPAAGALDPSLFFQIRPTRTQLGDFDRDGDPDYLSQPEHQGQNDGNGNLTVVEHDPAMIPAGFTTGLPRFRGDFDGDGASDFIVPLFVNSAFSHMALLQNNGSGHLIYAGPAAPMGQQIGRQPAWYMTMEGSPIATDLDGDSDIDIVVSADAPYEQPYHCEVWWNQGNGQFVAGPSYPTERTESVADFDGDGHVDLLMRTFDGVPSVRHGTGQLAAPFASSLPVLPPQPGFGYDLYVDAFVVVDANDDGRPDILAREDGAPGQDLLRLYCNTTTLPGNTVFQLSTTVLGPVGIANGNALFCDVNGDGRSDLIAQSTIGRGASSDIYIRTSGNGAVLQSSHYLPAVTQVIWDGFPADADGDGDIDLIGNFVVRNLQRHGPTNGLRRQYGDATAGEAGIAPLLGASGSLRAGETKHLRVSGITGPTIGVLALSLAPAHLPNVPPGALCLIEPTLAITGLWFLPQSSAGAARGASQLSILLPLGIQGIGFYEQLFVFDAAAPGGIAASNGLHVRVGS